MRVAVVQDWLMEMGGQERLLKEMLSLFPTADIFTAAEYLPEQHRAFLAGRRITTSFMQRLPRIRRWHRTYLPLAPLAIEQLDLAGYDLVVSNSASFAKGVLTGPDQVHVCNCCSPMRYAWDLQAQYLRELGLGYSPKGLAARYTLHRLRQWDVRTANGVDAFVAISQYIARRIWKVYRRDARVVYPPVDVDYFQPGGARGDYYVTASRLVPYKRVDLAVDAFTALGTRRLVVIGEGPEMARIRARAGPNVEFLGYQPRAVLREHLQRARAFIFSALEDFGIAPVEAQACGTPVIAFGRGAARETIRPPEGADPPTGVFFAEQTVESLLGAIRRFEAVASEIGPSACRESALRFAPARFHEEFRAAVEAALTERGAAGAS